MSENDEIIILTAIYDDWESVLALIDSLDEVLGAAAMKAKIVIVDDGSPHFADTAAFAALNLHHISEIRLVTLLRNMGNQRAQAIGLGYIANEMPGYLTVLMDSDFEDPPHYVPQLVAEARQLGTSIVFAERTQRSESRSFKMFYAVYKWLYKLLTGLPISIGNFSAIPARLVKRVAGISEISSHFPAGIMRARVPLATLPSSRGKRRFGQSKMAFVRLLIHGLSGLAVHADIVVVRMLLGILIFGLILTLSMGGIILLRLFTDLFILGWTSQILTLLGSILFQLLVAAILMVFLILSGRMHRMIIPIIDYAKFVMETETLYPAHNDTASDEH
ncbi:glycosyltransferase family 2 protein [Magnetospira thiophila]